MALIGTSKKLRDGSIITFTHKNPTTTFRAIKKDLIEKRSFEIFDSNIARTGSCYLSAYKDCGDYELCVDVRSSNHTAGTSPELIKFTFERTGRYIDGIEIDLSVSKFSVNDFRYLMDAVEIINSSEGISTINTTGFPNEIQEALKNAERHQI